MYMKIGVDLLLIKLEPYTTIDKITRKASFYGSVNSFVLMDFHYGKELLTLSGKNTDNCNRICPQL